MRVKKIKYVVMTLAAIAGIVWYAVASMSGSKDGLSITMEGSSGTNEAATDDSGGDRFDAADNVMEVTSAKATEFKKVIVYVCGAVRNPGVYELSEEALRVVNAIEAAGGFSEAAAKDYLNLARIVADGEKIEVPTVKAVEEGSVGNQTAETTASKGSNNELSVNINTATMEELMKLPGIGESRALSIIAYREENGAFGSIEEIMLVSGIKEGAFAKIKAFIRVTP